MEAKLKSILALYTSVEEKNIIRASNIPNQGIRYEEVTPKVSMIFNVICKRNILGIESNVVIKKYLVNVFEDDNLEIKKC